MNMLKAAMSRKRAYAVGVTSIAGAAIAVASLTAAQNPGLASGDQAPVTQAVQAAVVAEQQIGTIYPGTINPGDDGRAVPRPLASRVATNWMSDGRIVSRAQSASTKRLRSAFSGPMLAHELKLQRAVNHSYTHLSRTYRKDGALPTDGTSFYSDGGAQNFDFNQVDILGDTATVVGTASIWLDTDTFEPTGVVAFTPQDQATVTADLQRDDAGTWTVVSMQVTQQSTDGSGL